ncbi:MAG: hypothetical protein ABI333_14395 [bacterium]
MIDSAMQQKPHRRLSARSALWIAWAVPLTSIVMVLYGPGCSSEDAGACRTGDDPMGEAVVRTADCDRYGCSDQYAWTYHFDVSGDATVVSLTQISTGEYTFELYFPQDATSVAIDVALPGDIPLPFDAGDLVHAVVHLEKIHLLDTLRRSAEIDDQQGLLLSLTDDDLAVDPLPSPCEVTTPSGIDCGTIGYPTRSFFCQADPPADPCAKLRQGESATLEWDGKAYSVYLKKAYVYVPPTLCTETPQGWENHLILRRLDLESQ